MKNKKNDYVQIAVMGICILFFCFLFFIDGVQFSADSQSYIGFSYGREPLYPLFLTFFRLLFGNDVYLIVVVFVQCMIWAVVTSHLTGIFRKKFHLHTFSVGIVLAFQLSVVLLCRFVASRHATYCNEICSEGLAIPLFSVFVVKLLEYVWDRKNCDLIFTMLSGAALISVRKQMYIAVLIMGCISFLLFIGRKISFKKLFLAWGAALTAFLLASGLDLLYNFCLRGEAMRHTTDSSAMVITLLYCADSEDAGKFDDPAMASLFQNIMQEAEESEYTYRFAEGNWLNRYVHYSDHYDLLAFGVVNPHFYEYLDETVRVTGVERELAFDDINRVFISTLLPVHWQRLLHVTADNMLVGLCNTVSKAYPILTWYNILFGICYIGLMIFMAVRQKKDAFWLALTVLVSVLVNVVAVGVMIFAQTRYMIYNMPFVYIAMYLMLREIYLRWKSKKHKESICEK